MCIVPVKFDCGELVLRYLHTGLIVIGVQHGFDAETAASSRVPNQINNSLKVDQWPTPPVEADEGKQPVLDLVPLAGSRGIVTYSDRSADFIRQPLEFDLPSTQTGSVAPTTVGADQEACRERICSSSVHSPPPANALDREFCSVVRNPNVHHGAIALDVVRSVRNGLTMTEVDEIMDVHLVRVPFAPPSPTRIFKGSDEFLLLCVDRYDSIAGAGKLPHLSIDVAKLGVSVRMLPSLPRFGIALQRIPHFMEVSANCHLSDRI